MSKQNMFTDLVFGLSDKEFSLLQGAVSMRLNKERYGATTFNELAVKYKRMPSCPDCGSEESIKSSLTPDGIQRYICKDCGCRYNLLSNTIFHSTNRSFSCWTT